MSDPMPKVLLRRLPSGDVREVKVGDILLNTRGKTFFVTGWNETEGVVEGTSTCEQHYFLSVPAKIINCYFMEV
jgi:hypothetical protein